MTRTTPLTAAEHRQLGAELHAIQHRLNDIGVALVNRHGTSSKIGRLGWRLGDVLTKIRSALDDALAGDHPADFDPRVYYPGGEPTSTRWETGRE